MITITYDGGRAPPHLRDTISVKNITLKHGEPKTVTPEVAGMIQACAPAGTVKIEGGAVVPWAPKPATLKAAQARIAGRPAADPTAFFSAVPSLPTVGAATDLLRLKDDDLSKVIADGKLDEHATAAAILLHVAGRPVHAMDLIRRVKAD
jgi:hypothetical protein